MAREIRLRYRDLLLASVVALALDVVAVALVYAVDASRFGPLRRFYGPWGLPCASAARCRAPCAETTDPHQERPAEGVRRPSSAALTVSARKRARPTEVVSLDGP
jgi:hypothetical protein